MVSSSYSSPSEAQAVVSKSQSMEEGDEMIGPYQLPSRNNISRQYNRKDDNPAPAPHSPTFSEILDGPAEDDIIFNDSKPKDELGEPERNDDAKLSEEGDEQDEDDEWGIDDPMFEQRVYESPRLISEDDDIFPPAESHEFYGDSQTRWGLISEQAGPHKQDGASLMIRRNMKPSSLRKGIMSQLVATRVRSLSLWLDHEEDILPQWLDVISMLFPNLEHLSLSQDYFEGEEEIEVSSRMRRLYILYRLPDLLSIDGKAVTGAERSIARPSTPNGERVQQNDWMDKKTGSSLLDNEDNEKEVGDYDDIAPQIPANASIGNATAMELGAELAQLTEKIAIIHDDNDGDQYCNSTSKTSSMDDESSLAGELLVDLTATSYALSGEQREDRSSDPGDRDSRDADEQPQSGSAPTSSQQPSNCRTLTASLLRQISATSKPAAPPNSRRKSVQAPSRTASARDHPDGTSNRSSRTSTAQIQRSLLSQPSTADTLDLVSVASSHHEWTAACGVLSFRSDRACAPRLRLNFCGRGNRKWIAEDDKKEVNVDSFKMFKKDSESAKLDNQVGGVTNSSAPREHLRNQIGTRSIRDSPTNLSTNDGLSGRSPLRDKFSTTTQKLTANRQTNVDPPTANQKLPPSKSLSSPFPMQFRERTPSLHISTEETDLAASKSQQNIIPSSPRARGSFPIDTITEPMTLTILAPSSSPAKKTAPSAGTLMMAATKHGNSTSTSGKLATKGELPPPCPPTARRKVVAASLLQRDPKELKQSRRERKMERRKRAFQENARSTSMFDEMDDDTEDDSSVSEDDAEAPVYREEHSSSVHQGNDW